MDSVKADIVFHLHFGAGKLAIGAVLPALNPAVPLVIVQIVRGSDGEVNWEDAAAHHLILLANDVKGSLAELKQSGVGLARFHKWFRCCRKRWRDTDPSVSIGEIPVTVPHPCLVIVDHLKQVSSLLSVASSVSCALGAGQSDLARLLDESIPSSSAVPLLAFENTVAVELRSSTKWKVFPIITDRICSGRKLYDRDHAVFVECEVFLSIIAPDAASHFLNPNLIGKGMPIHIVPKSALDFHSRKKRALVNSLHQLFALFCLRALSEQALPSGGQYLPVVMAWFRRDHPDFHHAIELYRRVRALQLMWPAAKAFTQSGGIEPVSDDIEAMYKFYGGQDPQMIYDEMLEESADVVERFSTAPDELRRLINPNNLRKELKNYREHILQPMDFIRRNDLLIKKFPIYDKPNLADLSGLENLLTETFLSAMDKAMTSIKE